MTSTPPADPSVARSAGSSSERGGTGKGARAQRSRADSARPDVAEVDPAGTDTDSLDPELVGPVEGTGRSGDVADRAVGSTESGEVTATTPAAPVDEVGRAGSGVTLQRVVGYRRQRFEARKVRRLIRHVDPWSMLKLAVLVSLCMWLVVMIAALVLWTVARNAGTITNVESFVNDSLSLQDWQLDGEFIFRQFGLITLLLALGFAAATVVASLVFNLISDIIGGVWVSVIEEETARPVAESKRDEVVG